MPPRKEFCKFFARGSCRNGNSCNYLHATPQQSNANPFGFGNQASNPSQRVNQQQQAPNPFGFGMQNKNQSRGGNDFGSKPNQNKPFENTWSRSSNVNTSGASVTRQSEKQQPVADHKCTDSESCKRIIVEDFQHEKPLWKLTCYGHNKNGPCDIVGDISCEELRALAYDDAKNGTNFPLIVERERSLLNSKLVEFQNLMQKPSSNQNPFGVVSANATTINSGFSPTASNFSQLHASLSSGPSPAVPNYSFGQKNTFQNNSQPSAMFQTNNSPFNTSGSFASRVPQQQPGQGQGQGSVPFGSASAQTNLFSSFANVSQTGNVFDKPLNFASNEPFSAPSIGIQLSNNTPKENTNADDSIWKKAEWKWNAGEIPEDAPPDIYIH
ncbi:hypothetical protein ABFX02_12G136400 [Erythranthe guttata]